VLGTLISDIVCSSYGWHNFKAKDFQPLVAQRAFFSDNTVLTTEAA